MLKFNRKAFAPVLATALLAGGYAWVSGSHALAADAPKEAPKQHHRTHEKLHEADDALKQAEIDVAESKDDFHGHKAEILKRLNEARTEISIVLAEDKKADAAAAATQPSTPPVPPAPPAKTPPAK